MFSDFGTGVLAEAVADENCSNAVPVEEVEDADCVEEDVKKVVEEESLEVVNKSDNEVDEVDVVE